MSNYKEKEIHIRPDSVRVSWWYKAQHISRRKFEQRLGQIFIPSWVLLTSPIGMTSYYPSLVPEDKCQNVPDETAIVFFESQDVYKNRRVATAGRLAGYELHQVVFDMEQKSGPKVSFTAFPILMEEEIKTDIAYYLIDQPADWFHGTTDHYLGVFTVKSSQGSSSHEKFLPFLYDAMSALQTNKPEGLSGLLFGVSSDTFMMWANWSDADDPGRSQLLKNIKNELRTVLDAPCTPTDIPLSLSDEYSGVDVKPGTCYDTRFRRRQCYL